MTALVCYLLSSVLTCIAWAAAMWEVDPVHGSRRDARNRQRAFAATVFCGAVWVLVYGLVGLR